MKYEEILREIDGFGKFQKTIVFLLLLSTIPNGLFTMVTVFILDTPDHHCKINTSEINSTTTPAEREEMLKFYIPREQDEYGKIIRSKCKKFSNASFFNETVGINRTIIGCESDWNYHPIWNETTAVTEWDIVCENAWLKPLMTALYMTGVLFGSAVSGALSDRYGRRPVFLWGTLGQFASMFANGFSTNSTIFAVTMFIAGCTHLLNYVAAFVLATELVDSSKRALVGSLEIGGFTIGYMLLPALAYFITDWKWLMRTMGLLGILFIPYYWWIPESPRWLIMNGKDNEAKQIIREIAKKNRKKAKEDDLELLAKDELAVIKSNDITEQFTYIDLLRNPSIRSRSLVMFIVWFSTSMTYYCISLGTSNLGGNKFLNCFVAAAVEGPAYVSSYFLMERLGRRTVLALYLIVGGVACAVAPVFLMVTEWLMITSSMISKFSVTGVFSLIYIFCCEMFPTKMRNMSVGASSTMARVGAIAAPYLIFAGESVSIYIPYLLMGGFAVISGSLCLILPETLNVPLPETLEDSVKMDRYKLKIFRNQSARTITLQEIEMKSSDKP